MQRFSLTGTDRRGICVSPSSTSNLSSFLAIDFKPTNILFGSIPELLEALRDAIKAHRSLYTKGKILHRDISENNIIITDPKEADGFKGMLIDEDLAKEIGSGRGGARHQTGTMEFMAIQVLQRVAHTY